MSSPQTVLNFSISAGADFEVGDGNRDGSPDFFGPIAELCEASGVGE